MSEIKDGGPAFSRPGATVTMKDGVFVDPGTDGMSLRDYFAAKAMAAYLMPAGAGQTWAQRSDFDYIARTAYLAADAMLEARSAT